MIVLDLHTFEVQIQPLRSSYRSKFDEKKIRVLVVWQKLELFPSVQKGY